ncbi:MAG: hypothetical protein GY842_22460 [bacterium]|nr:hypothetical protein [bacterium]
MNRVLKSVLLPVLAVSVMVTGTVWADEEQANAPLDQERQSRLLERFGDKGIDADGDGALTRDEVRTFFAEMRGERRRDHRGERGFEGRGFGPHDRGPMGRVGMALHHLELLSGETPPEQFDLAKHSDADADGDGQLSDAEWQAFSEAKRAEILARLAKRHAEADADGDGTLTDAELETVKVKFLEHLLVRHPEADTDGDGGLTMEEARAFHDSSFEQHKARILEIHPELDTDGDGALSDAEMRAGRGEHYGRYGGRGKGCRGGGLGAGRLEMILKHHPEADLDGDGELSEDELDKLPKGEGRRGKGRRGCGRGAGPFRK